MTFRPEHDLHRRRFGRNLGIGLLLAGFVALVFALTVVKVTRGDKCDDSGPNPCHPPASGDPDCTEASCGFITVEVHNFFGPVTCTITAQAEGVLGTVDLADGDTKQTQFYFGVPGRWVDADCQGPGSTRESDRLDWPS